MDERLQPAVNSLIERFAAHQSVNNRWIGLQPHALVQAIDEDRRDVRALLRLAGFLFDDRGQNNRLFAR